MARLIAIGYPDETTAYTAQLEADRRVTETGIGPDAVAAIVREVDGTFRVSTSHRAGGGGPSRAMWWCGLFGMLFFVPVHGGSDRAGFDRVMDGIRRGLREPGGEPDFEVLARDMLQPGTSALFLLAERADPVRAVEALRQFGGTVLQTATGEDFIRAG